MIEVLATGALNTVQDLGRHECLRWGVGTAGAMDDLALSAGNCLLGNESNAAGIEVQVFPFKIKFLADCRFALTGADCDAQLDMRDILPWFSHFAKAGQTLNIRLPRLGNHRTSRAYLCLAGGLDVPRVLNSRSTQMRGSFGGHQGRPLRAGDVLATLQHHDHVCTSQGILPPEISMPLTQDGCRAVRVLPAAEYLHYSETSQAQLWHCEWKITPQSDRYGFRLAGDALQLKAPLEMRSHGIVPGVIQVPPDGQPIVQMRDAQPTGGYPKVGTIIQADLWRFAQLPIGSRVRFIETTWNDALEAQLQNQHWLNEIKRQARLLSDVRGTA